MLVIGLHMCKQCSIITSIYLHVYVCVRAYVRVYMCTSRLLCGVSMRACACVRVCVCV